MSKEGVNETQWLYELNYWDKPYKPGSYLWDTYTEYKVDSRPLQELSKSLIKENKSKSDAAPGNFNSARLLGAFKKVNGRRIVNFNYPSNLKFDSGDILPACSPEQWERRRPYPISQKNKGYFENVVFWLNHSGQYDLAVCVIAIERFEADLILVSFETLYCLKRRMELFLGDARNFSHRVVAAHFDSQETASSEKFIGL